jgi:pimeloyl-ACP methyl ester carboxylesterase
VIELGHKVIGDGDIKIIFLHELMGDCRNYEPSFPYLDTKNFTNIFVDLRGYGLSKEIKGDYNCEEAASDVINLISILNYEEVIIVAHSMSTMIAQKIALLDKRVKKLLLITPIPASGIKVPELAKEQMLKQMGENVNKIEEIVENSSLRYNQTWKDYRINMAYSSSIPEARVGYMNMYLTTNFEEEAKSKISIPIKIIVGKHDFPVFEKKQIEKGFSGYKNVDVIECQEAGHYPMCECPAYFATNVETFCK